MNKITNTLKWYRTAIKDTVDALIVGLAGLIGLYLILAPFVLAYLLINHYK